MMDRAKMKTSEKLSHKGYKLLTKGFGRLIF